MRKHHVNYLRRLIPLILILNLITMLLTVRLVYNTSILLEGFEVEGAPTIQTPLIQANIQGPIAKGAAEHLSHRDEIVPTPMSTPTDPKEIINEYVRRICTDYPKVKPELVMSIIQQESEYRPSAKNGDCVGLMQVSKRWHSNRAAELGVKDFYDTYGNILIGVDYLSELFTKYKDPRLVLMLYSMKHDDAIKSYTNGKISGYAKTVLARAEAYKKGE